MMTVEVVVKKKHVQEYTETFETAPDDVNNRVSLSWMKTKGRCSRNIGCHPPRDNTIISVISNLLYWQIGRYELRFSVR